MSTANGVEKSKEAFRQAGRAWPSGPRMVEELPTPPVEDPMPRLRVEEPPAMPIPVTPVVMPTPMNLNMALLDSLALVGLGIAIGYGAAMLVVFINGRL